MNREELRDCLCLASRKAARTITRSYDAKLRPLGIRATQFTLLSLILGFEKIGIGKLAEISGTERTTLSRNLALLEAAGLIAISAGDDARERFASVTRKGRAIVEKAIPLWREAQAAAAAHIGREGVDALHALAGRAGTQDESISSSRGASHA